MIEFINLRLTTLNKNIPLLTLDPVESRALKVQKREGSSNAFAEYRTSHHAETAHEDLTEVGRNIREGLLESFSNRGRIFDLYSYSGLTKDSTKLMVNDLSNVCHPVLKSMDYIDILNRLNSDYDANLREEWIKEDTIEAIAKVISWNLTQVVDSAPTQIATALFNRPNALRDSLSSLADNRGKAVLSWMKFNENPIHSADNVLSPRYIYIHRYI
jgi:hypothetical protein